MKCPSLAKLLDYSRNQGSDRARDRIGAHLATKCPVCHENLQWLETVSSAAAQDDSYELPKEVFDAIVDRFNEWAAARRRPLRQVIADLIFDSGLQPQLAGARSHAEESASRRALYHVEGYDIDLSFELSEEHDQEQLIGHLLPAHREATKLPPFEVNLLQSGSMISATNTDQHGVFKFTPLASGTYDLKIFVPNVEIDLERVPTARAL